MQHLRAVPEIILGGGTFFFRSLHPQDTHGVRAPRPAGQFCEPDPPSPGHAPLWIKYALTPPGQVNPPPPGPDGQRDPPPLGHIVNKTPSPYRTKKCLRPTPLRIISGTALTEDNTGIILGKLSIKYINNMVKSQVLHGF